MKKILILSAALLALTCSEKNKDTNTTVEESMNSDSAASTAKVTGTTSNDEILNGSVTNNAGITLKQSYNKTRRTAVFEVNGEIIMAKQDTVASGIQYSNEHYLYKEHRGDISLYKDGVLVWDNIR